MSVSVKDGVEFEIIAPAGFLILSAIKRASAETGLDLVITSGTDGEHSGPMDPHKLGEAYDVRSKDFVRDQKFYVLKSIMDILGWEDFYGFLENPEMSNEHYHIQRKRNTVFTVEDFLNV